MPCRTIFERFLGARRCGVTEERRTAPESPRKERGNGEVPRCQAIWKMQQKRWPGSFESFDEILPLEELLHAQPLGRGSSLGQCEG